MVPSELRLRLPAWVAEMLPATVPDDTAAMRLAIDLARRNVEQDTGGPFGAVVADADGRVIAVGVNLVVPESNPTAHAEIVAIALAGQALGSFDLGASGPATLFSSVEPCAMCLGAVPWSGVARLVCGARDEDARAVGFDEGDKPPDWAGALVRRGVTVLRDALREDAAEVLRAYAEAGGPIYNG